ncbi:MAG TPA: hypothetical protein VF221_04490, partial [Chloroflexota bacterium]
VIEPRLAAAVRAAGLRLLVPGFLAATMIAELQISLVAHWLTGKYTLNTDSVAKVFIATTRAVLVGISSPADGRLGGSAPTGRMHPCI